VFQSNPCLACPMQLVVSRLMGLLCKTRVCSNMRPKSAQGMLLGCFSVYRLEDRFVGFTACGVGCQEFSSKEGDRKEGHRKGEDSCRQDCCSCQGRQEEG